MYSYKKLLGIAVISVVLAMTACQKNDSSKPSSQNQPAVSPLVDFRQKINMKTPLKTIKLGKVDTATVTITNTGSEDWPIGGASPVNLAYHWIDKSQTIVVFDGERTALPKTLKAGESVTVQATIKSPDQPGEYTLRLSMVQEQVAWFDDRGAKALNLPVTIK